MAVDADLLRFSSESTESQNQAGLLAHPSSFLASFPERLLQWLFGLDLLAHPNLPPSHSEFVSGQWLFVTNQLWITPQGLQLRGQLRHLPNSLLIPRAQMRGWEPISVANIASFSR